MERTAEWITSFFASEERIILLTKLRKQRMKERHEETRARTAMARCVSEGHTVEEDAE